jgi:hypothetical protein
MWNKNIYLGSSNSLINQQENKDFYIASRFFQDLAGEKPLYLQRANYYCSVDMYGMIVDKNGNQCPFNVEIKQRIKSKEELELYPEAELKKDKLERMEKATASGTRLYYLSLVNSQIGYLFDMTNLDMNQVREFNWTMKKTEFSDNDQLITVPTLGIPFSLAVHTLPLEQYYKDWYGLCAHG